MSAHINYNIPKMAKTLAIMDVSDPARPYKKFFRKFGQILQRFHVMLTHCSVSVCFNLPVPPEQI